MKRGRLDIVTKISGYNLDRIRKLKISGYEPNDYIIEKGIDLLEKNTSCITEGIPAKRKLGRVSKISAKSLIRISKLKISGYEPNDYIIEKALDLLENE